ncbi:MAG: PEP-CTERM sorting domain-containing protein [Gemmataceae bacterium]
MSPSRSLGCGALALTVGWLAAGPAAAQVTVRSGTAPDIAGITVFRDQFRTDIGGGTTAGANGLFDDGTRQRREINWDGVGAAFAAPNLLPANFFNSNSPRGVVFSTAGTGFAVSGATTDTGTGQPAAANFGNIDASYTTTFSQFSAQRLFTQLGSTQMDVNFFIPGTTTPAGTRAFGVIFSDVEQAGTTALQFFDLAGNSIGAFAAPPQSGATGFSFLGMFINDGSSSIGRVRITLGNTALGAGVTDNGTTRDLVVMDDFLYGNPVAVPEPTSLGLLGVGALGLYIRSRRKAATVA